MAKIDHLSPWLLGGLIVSAALGLPGQAWARAVHVQSASAARETQWLPDLKHPSTAEIRQRIPPLKGRDVTLLPLQALTFLPKTVVSELTRSWRAAGIASPEIVVIANGVYDLAKLEQLIHDATKFSSSGHHTYRSRVPVYVAPTATLVISGTTLQLTSKPLAPLLFHGRLLLVDARIEAAPGGGQPPGASYLLGWHGARLVAANSHIEGLGHPGYTGASGLTLLSPKPADSVILNLRKQLEQRTGTAATLIGNDLAHNFTGFQASSAAKVVLTGNRIHDSVSDNIRLAGSGPATLVSDNFIYSSKGGHGLSLALQSPGSHLEDNLILLNRGDGIRLSRNSDGSQIEANFIADNVGNGITLHESNRSIIIDNEILRNVDNGLRIRNGCQNRVESNVFFHNARYGVEIAAQQVNQIRSPKAGAEFIANEFDNNLLAALASRQGASLRLLHNRFPNSAPRYFAGDLAEYASQGLSGNQQDGFELPGDHGCR